MTNPVTMERLGDLAVIEVSNPPVNALSQPVRAGLSETVAQAAADHHVKAIVICCAGRTFIAGADIREFGKPAMPPSLPEVINQIEATAKPVVIALHGTALGGGLELALGGHYRVALASARFGLPEVTLGLLPGAGGTQRLPRLVPISGAIDMITTGRQIGAAKALDLGLIDKIAEGEDTRSAGLDYAKALIEAGQPPRPTSALPCNPPEPGALDAARSRLAKSARGQIAPQKALDALQGAVDLPFAEGLAQERALFHELMNSDQRGAMIHAFFSERQVGKLDEIKGLAPRAIQSIGVVGGGTMGAGIATSALLSGLNVTLVERNSEAAERARTAVTGLLESAVTRGKLSEAKYGQIKAECFKTTTDYADFAPFDLVIEAVFESLDVKKEVFGKLDAVCKPGAILATNTSYLDVNAIAAMTVRPQDVIGLHFFSPAHVMKLLEVVVADNTAPEVTATGFALAKMLGKVAVRSGVCDGFIGNRILSHYRKALDGAVIAGASPYDVDSALVEFGLAMGPYAVSDLAGLDIGWATRKRLAPTRDKREAYAEFADRLCELGRFGRKTGRGYYLYTDGRPARDPEVEKIIAAERAAKGIKARPLSAQEIVDRYMAAMVNEAARVIEEGIARRPLDVDVTLLNGYGYPRWRGGPMYHADTVGLDKILRNITTFAAEDDFLWQPAPLLQRLVAEGKTFSSLNT
ncbi:FAD-dependent oxidoreductase [Ruegeria hyattellae]|uniref:FAD-dependent oxidoreductase n=1 Tax=Ruegeria hyattellae TaxID=3233337 RepID=UPI00355B2839